MDLVVGFIGGYFDITGIPINQFKMYILYGIIILVNLSVLYLNTILFATVLLYFGRIGYKMHTNFLINKENIQFMNLNVEHILSLDEKKLIFLEYLSRNNVNLKINNFENILKLYDTKVELLQFAAQIVNEYKLNILNNLNNTVIENSSS